MGKPRKVLTKDFKKSIIAELNLIHGLIDQMKGDIESEKRVKEYLKVLNVRFSKIELMTFARRNEVNK